MPFIRKAASLHPKMLISYCGACGALVAASPEKSLVATVEALHHCSGIPRGKDSFNKKSIKSGFRKGCSRN
jgi:hypothetical protein